MFGLQYTFEEITDRVQASKQSVEQGLEKLQACQIKGSRYSCYFLYMSHFAYACKMRCPLNLVLENSEYLVLLNFLHCNFRLWFETP